MIATGLALLLREAELSGYGIVFFACQLEWASGINFPSLYRTGEGTFWGSYATRALARGAGVELGYQR
jgi:hypothetical protein